MTPETLARSLAVNAAATRQCCTVAYNHPCPNPDLDLNPKPNPNRKLCSQLRLAMGSRVLTPVQFARVHLETYPAGVDVVALTKCGSGVG